MLRREALFVYPDAMRLTAPNSLMHLSSLRLSFFAALREAFLEAAVAAAIYRMT
jgi:hypothetical protein